MWRFLSIGIFILWFLSGCAGAPKKQAASVQNLPIGHAKPVVEVEQKCQTNAVEQKQVAEKQAIERKPQIVQQPIIITNNLIVKKPEWSNVDLLTNIGCVVSCVNSNWDKRCIVESKGKRIEIYDSKRFLRFNGVTADLGFYPRFEDGHCFVNYLDYDATILPLLTKGKILDTGTTVIVIDPGHGGNDPGTRNILNGKPEKDYTVDVAKRVQKILVDSGWKTILTRTNDIRVERPTRIDIAGKAGANVFVSIHFNYVEKSRTVSGIETYCLTPSGMSSSFNRGFNDNVSASFLNNGFNSENIMLAADVQSAIIKKTNSKDRGVKHARFLDVLQNQRCPAILVEAGFLSSDREAELIDSVEYRQLLASAIAEGIMNFCVKE